MNLRTMRFGILTGTIALALGASPAFAASVTPASPQKTQPATTETKPSTDQKVQQWGDRIFDEFQQMEQRMDRLFNEATHEMNQKTGWMNETNFTSSVKMSQDGNDYIVRLSLPDRDLSKVDARVEGNTLHITAREEKKEHTTSADKKGTAANGENVYELGRYEQLLSLPGPVDAANMKIDRSGSTLTITLPKSEHAPAAPTPQG